MSTVVQLEEEIGDREYRMDLLQHLNATVEENPEESKLRENLICKVK